jgi:hypothetical protein
MAFAVAHAQAKRAAPATAPAQAAPTIQPRLDTGFDIQAEGGCACGGGCPACAAAPSPPAPRFGSHFSRADFLGVKNPASKRSDDTSGHMRNASPALLHAHNLPRSRRVENQTEPRLSPLQSVDTFTPSSGGPLARPSQIPVGCEVDAMPAIVQERAQTSQGVPETAPPFLGNEPTGTSWDFSRIPLHPSSAAAKRLPGPIQTKLKVGAIDDPLEHEADRVADQVMRMPASDAVTISSRLQVSRKCDECEEEEEEEEELQKKEARPQTVAGEAPASVHETLRTAGQPLDMESRAFFEPRFGRDLSQVRIHADPRAAESAHSVCARAYTVGHHVVFGRGQYAPHTADGRHLVAHELTHTLQQQGGVPSLRRDPPESPPPARPDLETRLKIIEQAGPATQARLDQIIRTGGPMPNTKDGAKVIGAAIIDVEGYQGPKEMRAINGADTDALGQGAPVYHASSPTTRTLSATQGPRTEKGGRQPSILGPRKESINPHINDAEMKLFEDIIPRLPKGAKGTIYFTTVRVPKGQTEPEPYPACSGCIRATFETRGMLPGVEIVSHAPQHPPMATEKPPAQAGETPVKPPATGEPHAGAGEHEKPPAQAGETPVKPPATGEPAAGDVAQVKGPGGKSGTVTDAEPPSAVAAGGTKPVPKSTGPAPQAGRSSQMAIHIGTGIATAALAWLAAYLKARVDQKIAQRQIDAFLDVAKKRINANPDGALKKMMLRPEATVYAWISLDISVITTFGVDSRSPEPAMSDSSPMIDLSRIDYVFAPVDQSLIDSYPRISGTGYHFTTMRTIVIDIPLKTPPIEDMIGYAKARNLPLNDLLAYANSRYQAALSSYQSILDARQRVLAAYRNTLDAYQKLRADLQIAQKHHDAELQKFIADKLLSVANSLVSITDQLKPIGDSMQKSGENVKHWEYIRDLIIASG